MEPEQGLGWFQTEQIGRPRPRACTHWGAQTTQAGGKEVQTNRLCSVGAGNNHTGVLWNLSEIGSDCCHRVHAASSSSREGISGETTNQKTTSGPRSGLRINSPEVRKRQHRVLLCCTNAHLLNFGS